MYNYYKVTDEFFTHYYRVSVNSKQDGRGGFKCLHLNVSSSCINHGYFIPDKFNPTVVEEEEFNQSLEKIIDDLGINLKRFTFV